MVDQRTTNEHVQESIELLRQQIADVERDTSEKKKLVNAMSVVIGRPAVYRDQELCVQPVLTEDQFYGMNLVDALVEAFRWRRAAGRPASTVDELLELLRRGGFNSRSASIVNFRRTILKTLREDPQFHKLPGSRYGLAAWYPNATRQDGQPADELEGDGQDEVAQHAA